MKKILEGWDQIIVPLDLNGFTRWGEAKEG